MPSAIKLPSVLSTPVPFGLILISAFDEFVVIKASLIVNWLLPVPMLIALLT